MPSSLNDAEMCLLIISAQILKLTFDGDRLNIFTFFLIYH